MSVEPAELSLHEILVSSASNTSEKAALETTAGQKYLNHLTALPLSSLLSEPTQLQTQAHHLTSSLISFTHSSYPTFLSLQKTTASLSTSLSSLSASLDALLSSIPALEESSSSWRERTESVLTERKRVRLVLEQHEKIRDLLDIPLLIDACVRNGYFAEALSLAAHARSLSKFFVADTSDTQSPLIVASILAEVNQSISQMLISLLGTLHEPHRKLPALWKAVNFLRRMDVFSAPGQDELVTEQLIALAFLSGREACIRSTLDGVGRDVQGLIRGLQEGGGELGEREKEDLARYLKKYIDVWREGVYDIITQYTTIFLERSSPVGTASAVTTQLQDASPSEVDLERIHHALRRMLSTYATHALTTHLLPRLAEALPQLTPSALPSLLTQLTYCSNAFARVGLDFRGLLGDIFGKAVSASVDREFRHAVDKWIGKVKKAAGSSPEPASMRSPGKDKKPLLPSQWIVASSLVSSPPFPPSPSPPPTLPPHIPPPILASYPPLAEFTNNLLTTLNGLRLLAPTHIMGTLVQLLSQILADGGWELVNYTKNTSRLKREKEELAREENIVKAVCEVYINIFVPFIRRALLEGVYGVKDDGTVAEQGLELLQAVSREWKSWLEKKSEGVPEHVTSTGPTN